MYVYHVTVYLLADKLATKLGLTMPLSPIPAFLYMTALIGVTIILAKFSYEFFESRFLSLKRYFEPRYEKPLLESSFGSGPQRDSPVAS
jgi:peptidoglycan/LPS O-acetylase OafA/YrhL